MGTHQPIIADGHVQTGPGLPLRADLIMPDDDGNVIVAKGLALATDTGSLATGTYYVPCTTAETYGANTGTAVGILMNDLNATENTQPLVAPATHAAALDRFCYVIGEGYGTVTDAMWTAMSSIQRRSR